LREQGNINGFSEFSVSRLKEPLFRYVGNTSFSVDEVLTYRKVCSDAEFAADNSVNILMLSVDTAILTAADELWLFDALTG